jgi:hypothetical protein
VIKFRLPKLDNRFKYKVSHKQNYYFLLPEEYSTISFQTPLYFSNCFLEQCSIICQEYSHSLHINDFGETHDIYSSLKTPVHIDSTPLFS